METTFTQRPRYLVQMAASAVLGRSICVLVLTGLSNGFYISIAAAHLFLCTGWLLVLGSLSAFVVVSDDIQGEVDAVSMTMWSLVGIILEIIRRWSTSNQRTPDAALGHCTYHQPHPDGDTRWSRTECSPWRL